MKGVLNHSRNRIKEIRKNQPNRQSGETFRIAFIMWNNGVVTIVRRLLYAAFHFLIVPMSLDVKTPSLWLLF
jgi:hypothetical protein